MQLENIEATASGATKLSNTEKHRKKRLDLNSEKWSVFEIN